MKINKFNIVIISFWLILISCSLENKQIQEKSWLYGKGFNMGDWLTFDGKHSKIINDTIYLNDTAIAIISKTTKGYFGVDNEIELTSIKTGNKGIYHEK